MMTNPITGVFALHSDTNKFDSSPSNNLINQKNGIYPDFDGKKFNVNPILLKSVSLEKGQVSKITSRQPSDLLTKRHVLSKRSARSNRNAKKFYRSMESSSKKTGASMKKVGYKMKNGIQKYGLLIASKVVKYTFKVVGKLIPIPGFALAMSYAGNIVATTIEYADKGANAIRAAVLDASTFGMYSNGKKVSGGAKNIGKRIADSM